MESRSRSCGVFESGPSLDARCSIKLSVPPSEVARVNSSTRETTFIAAPRRPFTRIDIIPPKPDTCFLATACPASLFRPGYWICERAGFAGDLADRGDVNNLQQRVRRRFHPDQLRLRR